MGIGERMESDPAQTPDCEICAFRLKETMGVIRLLLALFGSPDLQRRNIDQNTGAMAPPNNAPIRTRIKRIVLGHGSVWAQVGGKPPFPNQDRGAISDVCCDFEMRVCHRG
jgi:hypothetical protein